MSAIVTIAQLEALRTVALASVTACQGVLQTVESMIIAHDRVEPNDANPWGTFDDVPDDTHTGGRNGPKQKEIRK